MKAVNQREENVPDTTEIRPLLPGEISALFAAEMLQTQISWRVILQVHQRACFKIAVA